MRQEFITLPSGGVVRTAAIESVFRKTDIGSSEVIITTVNGNSISAPGGYVTLNKILDSLYKATDTDTDTVYGPPDPPNPRTPRKGDMLLSANGKIYEFNTDGSWIQR